MFLYNCFHFDYNLTFTCRLLITFLSSGDHLSCYMTQNREIKLKGEDKFWNQFGYLDTDNWEDKPSTELKYLRIRATKVPTHIQCGSFECLIENTLSTTFKFSLDTAVNKYKNCIWSGAQSFLFIKRA